MKVTIEGNADQVAATLSLPPSAPRTSRQLRLKEKAAEREAFAEKRRLIREAFERVRYNPEDKELSDKLLAALTRIGGMTEEALKVAKEVLTAPRC